MKSSHVIFSAIVLALSYIVVFLLGPLSRTWGDAALHFMAGIFLSILWLWISEVYIRNLSQKRYLFLSSMLAVFTGSVLWEGFEVVLRRISPEYATLLGFNSPVNDALSDILFAMAGGVVFLIFILWVGRFDFSDKSHNEV